MFCVGTKQEKRVGGGEGDRLTTTTKPPSEAECSEQDFRSPLIGWHLAGGGTLQQSREGPPPRPGPPTRGGSQAACPEVRPPHLLRARGCLTVCYKMSILLYTQHSKMHKNIFYGPRSVNVPHLGFLTLWYTGGFSDPTFLLTAPTAPTQVPVQLARLWARGWLFVEGGVPAWPRTRLLTSHGAARVRLSEHTPHCPGVLNHDADQRKSRCLCSGPRGSAKP